MRTQAETNINLSHSILMAFDGEIFEVFSQLPAKSIFRYTSVSKQCNEFATDKLFVQKQNRNMLSKNDSAFFIQSNLCGGLEFHALPGKRNSSGIPLHSLEFLKKSGRVLGSSNGLVCCKNTNTKTTSDQLLFICNPATRRYLTIPDLGRFKYPDHDFSVVFNCNVGSSDQFPYDYILMVMEGTENWSSDLICKSYSPKEGIWQERGLVNLGERSILFEYPVYYNGFVHFLSDWFPYITRNSPFYWPYIVALDLNRGAPKFIQLPKSARRGDFLDQDLKMGIFDWGKGESICLVKLLKGVFTVWVLSDYDSVLWTRVLKVHAWAMRMGETDPKIAGFIVFNGDSLLVATERKVYLYNLTGDWRWKRAEKVSKNGCGNNVLLYSYSNTLRPCGDGATPIPR